MPIHIVRCGAQVIVTVTGDARSRQPPAVEAAGDLPRGTEVRTARRRLPAIVVALAQDQPATRGTVADRRGARRAVALRPPPSAGEPAAALHGPLQADQHDSVDVDPGRVPAASSSGDARLPQGATTSHRTGRRRPPARQAASDRAALVDRNRQRLAIELHEIAAALGSTGPSAAVRAIDGAESSSLIGDRQHGGLGVAAIDGRSAARWRRWSTTSMRCGAAGNVIVLRPDGRVAATSTAVVTLPMVDGDPSDGAVCARRPAAVIFSDDVVTSRDRAEHSASSRSTLENGEVHAVVGSPSIACRAG